MSKIIKGIANKASDTFGTDSLNTEEVCAEIRVANQKIRDYKGRRKQPNRGVKVKSTRDQILMEDKFVIGSMDVSALYPSLQWIQTCLEINKGAQESKISLEDFDHQI